MPDQTPFERRLARRLDAELQSAVRPFEPDRIARHAIVARRGGDRVLRWLRLGDLVGSPFLGGARIVAIAALLVLAATIVAVAAGMILRPPSVPVDARLAVVLPDGSVALAALDGSDAGVVGRPTMSYLPEQVLWAPDGGHVAVIGNGPIGEMAIMDRSGRTTYQATLQRVAEVAWSSDGKELALLDARIPENQQNLADARLVVIDVNGSVVWSVELPPHFGYERDVGNLAWSREARLIAVTGGARSEPPLNGGLWGPGRQSFLWIADVDARTLRQATSGSEGIDYEPVWLSGNRILLGRHGNLDSGIWQLDLASGAMEKVVRTPNATCPAGCEPYNVRGVTPSPDGLRIAYLDALFDLSVIDIGEAEPRRLLRDGGSTFSNLAWSDDGSRLLILRQAATQESEPYSLPDLLEVDVVTGATRVIREDVRSFDLLRPPR